MPTRPSRLPPGQPSEEVSRVLQALRAAVDRFCPPAMRSSRDDMIQAAQLRLLEIDERGEQSAPRSTSYLWRVAYTTVVDEIRRLHRRGSWQLEEDGEAQAPQAKPQLRIDLRACLSALLAARRAAVILHLEGFRADEVASVLRADVKKAQNLVYRGLADLRRCLEAKGQGR